MKELSIEEKAKAYDEAIKKAKSKIKDDKDHVLYEDDIIELFPELAESEDEKIRKALVDYFTAYKEQKECGIKTFYGIPTDNIIAWLEKQGENISLPKFTFDDVLALQSAMAEAKNVQEDKDLYKQLESLHDRVHDAYWLEKKPIDLVAILKDYFANTPKEQREKDWAEIKHLNDVGFDAEIAFGAKDSELQEETYFIPKGYHAEIEGDKVVIKKGEQKPAGVEHKFKVGDWVVYCNGDVGLITGIEENGYSINNGGYYIPFMCASDMRMWTIKDAKDGDVLATEDWIFIFEKMNSNEKPVCHCHYDIELGFRIDANSYIATGSEIYPATKEQRDLLFKKIKEAGYEWDAEKKELRKIEQKPIAWSEEDLVAIDSAVDALSKDLPSLAASLRRIKSLSPQYAWKPSKGQMDALEEASNEHWEPDGLDPLYTLLQDLKKLMEEKV